jgi:hypothetical protein
MARLVESSVIPTHRRRDVEEKHSVNLNLSSLHFLLNICKYTVHRWCWDLLGVALLQVYRIGSEYVTVRGEGGIDCFGTMLSLVRHCELQIVSSDDVPEPICKLSSHFCALTRTHHSVPRFTVLIGMVEYPV